MAGLPTAPMLGLVVGVGASCVFAGTFACVEDAHCQEGEIAGTCEPSGYCSFTDPECESGARYSRFAGGGLARECTEASDTSAAAPTSTATSAGSEGSETTDAPPDQGPPPGRAPHEIECGNGLVEADEACDDANSADADGSFRSRSATRRIRRRCARWN